MGWCLNLENKFFKHGPQTSVSARWDQITRKSVYQLMKKWVKIRKRTNFNIIVRDQEFLFISLPSLKKSPAVLFLVLIK